MHAIGHDSASQARAIPLPVLPPGGNAERPRAVAWQRFIIECGISTWAVALLTFCAYVLHLDLSTAGFLYLLTVVIVAQTCGLWQATLTSVVAVAGLDYFIVPPIFSFDFGSASNLLALATFEFCALLVSRLSAREKRHALEAHRRRKSRSEEHT